MWCWEYSMSLLEEQSMLITTEPSLQAFPAKTLLNTCNMLVFLFGTEDALGLVPWVHVPGFWRRACFSSQFTNEQTETPR